MLNTYKHFEDAANELLHNKASLTEAKANDKSLSNEVAWSAFAVQCNGSNQDKAMLSNSIAKDAPLNKCKGMVSKAKAVLHYLIMHDEGIVTEEGAYTLEAINEALAEGIPNVTINGLYNVIKAENHDNLEALKRDKAITKEAMELMQALPDVVKAGIEVDSKFFNLHPKKAQFLADATVIVDNRLAAKAKAEAKDALSAVAHYFKHIYELETREQTLARIVSEVISLNLTDDLLNALASSSEAKAA